MEVRHGFQEARAAAPRTVGSAVLMGSGLALELHSRQSCVASRALPLLQTHRSGETAWNPEEGSGPPRASRQEATPTQAQVSYPRAQEEGKNSSHMLGLSTDTDCRGKGEEGKGGGDWGGDAPR